MDEFRNARATTSPKATGGGGYTFEHKVGAYFLSCLLKQEQFDIDVQPPKRLDFQTGGKGWSVDDLLITDNSGKLALSIRSNKQISANKFPEDFVSACWRLATGGDPFNIVVDYLGLVDPEMVPSARTAWQALSAWARSKEPNDLKPALMRKGEANDGMRSLYASFGCPPALATGIADVEILQAKLLSRVRVFNWDFENSSDDKLLHGLRNCREVLQNPDDAEKLWDRLIRLSADYDAAAGAFTQAGLYEALRRDFILKSPELLLESSQYELIYSLRLSEGECIEAWKLLGLSEEEATELLLDEKIGEGNFSYFPTTEQPIKVVVAPIGYGKTLLAQRALQRLVRSKLQDPNAPLAQIWSAENVTGLILDQVRTTIEDNSVAERSFVIIIDKLDEIDAGLAQKILIDCRKAIRIYSEIELQFLLLSRPLGWLDEMTERVDLVPPPRLELDQLFSKIAGRPRLWNWQDDTDTVQEALQAPLFVILAAMFVREKESYITPSRGELVSYWIDKRLSSDARFNHARSELTKLARYVLESPTGQVERAQIEEMIDVEVILRSGLARANGSKITFSLRILAEWFGSLNLKSKILNGSSLDLRPVDLDKWLPSFEMFFDIAEFEEIMKLFAELLSIDPAFCFLSFKNKGSRFFENSSDVLSPGQFINRMIDSMGAWVHALGAPISQLVAPVRSEGSLRPLGLMDNLRWHLGIDDPEQSAYAWSYADIGHNDKVFELEEFIKRMGEYDKWKYLKVIHEVSFRITPLHLWVNNRKELSNNLQNLLQRMHLPLNSPEATKEMVWGSALLGLRLEAGSTSNISVPQLFMAGQPLTNGPEISRMNGLPVYSKLLLGTSVALATQGKKALSAPYELFDPKSLAHSNAHDAQDVFFRRATDILMAAFIIYKEIVEKYFPSLKVHMNTYQLLPAKIIGKVSLHSYARGGFNAYITYAITPVSKERQTTVELKPATDSRWLDDETVAEIRRSFSQIEIHRPETYQWLHIHARGEPLEIQGYYPALEWAYKLLCWDLKELGVIEKEFETEAQTSRSHR